MHVSDFWIGLRVHVRGYHIPKSWYLKQFCGRKSGVKCHSEKYLVISSHNLDSVQIWGQVRKRVNLTDGCTNKGATFHPSIAQRYRSMGHIDRTRATYAHSWPNYFLQERDGVPGHTIISWTHQRAVGSWMNQSWCKSQAQRNFFRKSCFISFSNISMRCCTRINSFY